MLIAAWLKENIYYVSILVDSAQEILPLAPDCHEKLVQVPNVAQASLPAPEYAGVFGTELSAPLSDSLVRNYDPALCQQILNISEARTESMIEPNGMADDGQRESMSLIVGSIGNHRNSLPGTTST